MHSNKGQDKALTLHCGKCVQPWFNVWEFHVWVRLRVRVSAMLTGKFSQIRMIRKVSRWSANYRYDLKSNRIIWKCLNDMKRALNCRYIFQINEFKLFLSLVLVLKLLFYALLLQIWQRNLDVLSGKFLRGKSCCLFWLCGVVCGHLELFVQSSLVTSRPSKSFRKKYKKNTKCSPNIFWANVYTALPVPV